MLLFSEARFQFRQMRFGRPGDLFGTQALSLLETPWPGRRPGISCPGWSRTQASPGNFYGARRRGDLLQRLRPDWVTIVTGSRTGSELDTELVGYMYEPGGPASGEDPVVLLPEQVAHYAPIPDPIARFRGMSWLTPIVEEINADSAATLHKRTFFEQGATLGYVVTLDGDMNPAKFDEWVKRFKAGHEGSLNAYKTLFLAGGADIKTVGTTCKQARPQSGAGRRRDADRRRGRRPPDHRRALRGLAGRDVFQLRAGPPPRSRIRRCVRCGATRAGSLARIVNVPPAERALVRRP
jgi:hypothetical protein